MRFPKPSPFRSESYLRWIRTQPGVVSGQSGAEAAHVWASSIGSKSSDLTAIPLIPRFHRSDLDGLDKIGRTEFERRHNLSLDREIIRHLNRFLSEGHKF